MPSSAFPWPTVCPSAAAPWLGGWVGVAPAGVRGDGNSHATAPLLPVMR